MIVYRLEIFIQVGKDLRSFGPFTAGSYDPSLEDVTWNYKLSLTGPIPEPKEDGICGITSKMVFGWSNEIGFITWCRWKDVIEKLEAVGFNISAYEVPDNKVKVGETQVCWDPRHATLIKHVTWDYLCHLMYEQSKDENHVQKKTKIQSAA